MVSDITIEKLGKLLQENAAGLLAVRDELAGLIGSFDRYAAGGKGADAANWQQMYNASHLTIDRKCEAGTIFVERAAVSILGTIQPGTLRRVFAAPEREAGLLARFLVVNPPYEAQLYSDAEISEDVAAAWTAIIRGILAIETPEDDHGNIQTRYLGLCREASDFYIQWHDRLARELTDLVDDDLRAHWGKLKGICLRISLIFAVVDGLKRYHIERVDADAMRRAITIADWFKRESARLYSKIIIGGGGEGDRDRRRLIGTIRRNGNCVSVREWQRLRSHKTAADAEADLDGLVKAGLGSWQIPPQRGPGRPTKHFALRPDKNPRRTRLTILTLTKPRLATAKTAILSVSVVSEARTVTPPTAPRRTMIGPRWQWSATAQKRREIVWKTRRTYEWYGPRPCRRSPTAWTHNPGRRGPDQGQACRETAPGPSQPDQGEPRRSPGLPAEPADRKRATFDGEQRNGRRWGSGRGKTATEQRATIQRDEVPGLTHESTRSAKPPCRSPGPADSDQVGVG